MSEAKLQANYEPESDQEYMAEEVAAKHGLQAEYMTDSMGAEGSKKAVMAAARELASLGWTDGKDLFIRVRKDLI